MAELMTPEELGRKILAVFARNKGRVGTALQQGIFIAQAKAVGLDSRDISSALEAAKEAGLVEFSQNNSVVLTQSGFEAM